MFDKFRFRRPTHATIVSYLALFVALGGTGAYAINEWTGANIVDNSLMEADLGTNSVAFDELAYNSVTSGHIRTGGVNTSDASPTFKAPDSDKLDGIDSSALVRGYEVTQTTMTVAGNGFTRTRIDCPSGKLAIAGGFRELYPGVHLTSSYPEGGTWWVETKGEVGYSPTITLYAACANVR